jgi:hypothetical protein
LPSGTGVPPAAPRASALWCWCWPHELSQVRPALYCCAIWCAGDSGSATHICLAGEQCGATLLPTKAGGQGPPPYAHGLGAYFGLYGTGQFDGQNSGHDYLGTVSFSCFSRVSAGSSQRPR